MDCVKYSTASWRVARAPVSQERPLACAAIICKANSLCTRTWRLLMASRSSRGCMSRCRRSLGRASPDRDVVAARLFTHDLIPCPVLCHGHPHLAPAAVCKGRGWGRERKRASKWSKEKPCCAREHDAPCGWTHLAVIEYGIERQALFVAAGLVAAWVWLSVKDVQRPSRTRSRRAWG